jgi:hypothetical protein
MALYISKKRSRLSMYLSTNMVEKISCQSRRKTYLLKFGIQYTKQMI